MDFTLINQLEKCRLFSALPRETLIELVREFEPMQLVAGGMLFEQGDAPEAVYILLSGKLVSVLTKYSGEKQIVGSINPVETVGELGVLSGELRSLSVEAVIDSDVLKLSGSMFKKLCNDHSEFLATVSTLIVDRSLKTIKVMAHERPSYQLTLIAPILDNIPVDFMKEKWRSAFSQYENVFFISSDEVSYADMKHRIIEAGEKHRRLFIWMPVWDADVINCCVGKMDHLYLIANSTVTVSSMDHVKQHLKYFTKIRTELILFHPSKVKTITGTLKFLRMANFNLHLHWRESSDDDFQRVIRFMLGRATTLVLGGGGAKGLMHLGVIKAMLDKHIPIDAIGGSSAGASIAAVYAAKMNYEKLKDYFYLIKDGGRKSVSMLNVTWPVVSLFSSNPGTQSLQEVFEELRYEDLLIPCFSMASNLIEKCEVIQNQGLIWEGVRASVSIPGIWPPFVVNGKLYVDGGILNNLPVDVMRMMVGVDHTIIAVSLSRDDNKISDYSFPPVMSFGRALMSRFGYGDDTYPPFLETFMDALLLGAAAREEQNQIMADFLVHPNLSKYKMLSVEEKQEQELIDLGYTETNKVLLRYDETVKNRSTKS
jgi:NTE family protein